MMDMDGKYESFGEMLEAGIMDTDPSLDFVSICRMLGAEPDAFSRFVYARCGFTGDEIIRIYRPAKPSGGLGESALEI